MVNSYSRPKVQPCGACDGEGRTVVHPSSDPRHWQAHDVVEVREQELESLIYAVRNLLEHTDRMADLLKRAHKWEAYLYQELACALRERVDLLHRGTP